MKVLVISNMYPSKKDPVFGTFIQSFIEQLISLNGIKDTKKIVIKGRKNSLIYKVWDYVVFYFKIISDLLFHQYDLIYVHTIAYPIPPIRIVRLFKKLPLAFNVHGGDVLTRGKMANYLKKSSIPLLKEAKLIVAPSTFFKNILIKEFPFLKEDKIFVSPSGGVDSSFYNDYTRIENNIFTIGFVSRIDKGKGWDIYIKAINILKHKGYNMKGIIAGRGNQIAEMKEMIVDLSLKENINYIGPVPYNQLPQVYTKLDLFIFPTQLEESLGLVGLEAMGCKVPVIGSYIGGLKDYIKPNINGFFFESGNCEDLAKKIINYMQLSSKDKEIFKINAYNTACTYSSDKVKNDLYLKLTKII